MRDVVTLLGTESVDNAGSKMRDAAEKMTQAAREIDYSLSNHQRFLNDWLDRLSGILEELIPDGEKIINVRVVPEDGEETTG